MRRPLSLSARTLFLSFLCMCAVLLAGFFALNAAIRAGIRRGLEENLGRTQQQLDRTQTEYDRRTADLIVGLSDDASLKAAVGLLREQSSPGTRAQVQGTIQDQLREMLHHLDYDVLMVSDPEGGVVATVGVSSCDLEKQQKLSALPSGPGSPSLVRLGQEPYEVATVPINLGAENLGRLAVGKKFDLSSLDRFGYVLLLDRGSIVASTLPAALKDSVAAQLAARCGRGAEGCEIRAGAETYLALGVKHEGLAPDDRLLCLVLDRRGHARVYARLAARLRGDRHRRHADGSPFGHVGFALDFQTPGRPGIRPGEDRRDWRHVG